PMRYFPLSAPMVFSTRVVLPAPGELMRLITKMPRSSNRQRFSLAMRSLASRTCFTTLIFPTFLPPSVAFVVGCAGPLVGDHAGAHRVVRRAGPAEERALQGVDETLEDVPAPAGLVFPRLDLGYIEARLGVELKKSVAEPEPAPWYHS